MSRAEYLSKYLSGDDKKKKKKSKKEPIPSVVVVGGARSMPNVEHANDPALTAANDPENEYLPATVEQVSSKVLKGFRRIDNGQETKPTGSPLEVTPLQPQTVYRDQGGRIVDLDTKRRELQEEKQRKLAEEEALRDQLNTGELDALKREEIRLAESRAKRFDVSKDDKEYVDHMKQKDRFEDPMAMFGRTSTKTENKSKTGRPVYAGGVHPANRFKIKAGHFWDGIDRTNGFEDRLLEKRNEQHVQKVTKRASMETYTEYDFE